MAKLSIWPTWRIHPKSSSVGRPLHTIPQQPIPITRDSSLSDLRQIRKPEPQPQLFVRIRRSPPPLRPLFHLESSTSYMHLLPPLPPPPRRLPRQTGACIRALGTDRLPPRLPRILAPPTHTHDPPALSHWSPRLSHQSPRLSHQSPALSHYPPRPSHYRPPLPRYPWRSLSSSPPVPHSSLSHIDATPPLPHSSPALPRSSPRHVDYPRLLPKSSPPLSLFSVTRITNPRPRIPHPPRVPLHRRTSSRASALRAATSSRAAAARKEPHFLLSARARCCAASEPAE
jgi:hypothetical protein